ncbi:hypothetical protein Pmani_030138 [Petrolisthes manimaculis]|uniref:C2H2-type domain-containing protein n=1 Tax=Petrolisthes manimaculis TaxID=1843537 RepID=A0AAE1NXB2_9EUCA|nr:hypothetical protein Pmani_030138 [Petrolisthes manimaculis]
MESMIEADVVISADLFSGEFVDNLSESKTNPDRNFDDDIIYDTNFGVSETVLIEDGSQEYSGSCRNSRPVGTNRGVGKRQNIRDSQDEYGEALTARKYECEECKATFRRKTLLLNHEKKHRSGPPYLCEFCSVSFDNEDDLFDHREGGCQRSTVSKPPATRYINRKQQSKGRRRTAGKRFACRHCTQNFTSVCNRNDHELNIHERLRPYSCDQCGKTFYRKFNLHVHRAKHSTERPHVCQVCNKKFKSTVYLKMHMKLHTNEKPFMCHICGKVFRTASSLETHHTVHTQESKFTCKFCGQRYRYRASLFLHMRKHNGQRPYQCSECSAAFMVKSHLTDHFRIHSGDRPFQCEICNLSFPRPIGLKKHLISHARAGVDVNIDDVLYRAKLKANMKPRTPVVKLSQQNARCTDDIQEDRTEESEELLSNSVNCNDCLLVVTITSTGDGSTCSYDITRVSATTNTSMESDNINNALLYKNCDIQDESIYVYRNDLIGNEQNKEHLPLILSINETAVSETEYNSNDIVHITDIEQINMVGVTTVDGVVTDSGGYCDNVISTEFVAVSEEGTETKCIITDGGEYCGNVNADLVPVLEVGGETANLMPVSNVYNETALLEHSLNNLLISHQEIAVMREAEMSVGEGDLNASLPSQQHILLPHPDSGNVMTRDSQTSIPGKQSKVVPGGVTNNALSIEFNTGLSVELRNALPGGVNSFAPLKFMNATTPKNVNKSGVRVFANDNSKSIRKPLKKCQYCSRSYRYPALLTAHEENHRVQQRLRLVRSPVPEKENNSMRLSGQNPIDEGSCSDSSSGIDSERPFKCDKCTSRFSFRSELRKHVKLHSVKYHYTCGKCKQVFQQEAFLARHQCGQMSGISQQGKQTVKLLYNTNNYTEGGEYKCNECGKVFEKRFILEVHYRKHTGNRPFACGLCGDRFISATHRRVHYRLHTGERPFSCVSCGKAFVRKYKLEQHTLTCKELPVKETPNECTGTLETKGTDTKLDCDREEVAVNSDKHQASGIHITKLTKVRDAKQTNITISPNGIVEISTVSLDVPINSEEVQMIELDITLNEEKENMRNGGFINNIFENINSGEETVGRLCQRKTSNFPEASCYKSLLQSSTKPKKNVQDSQCIATSPNI